MKHQTPDELERAAVAHAAEPAVLVMTRAQRIERWAELLARDPARRLNTLPGTEYQPLEARNRMRIANSPISVAFDDPVLRDQGLTDDSYGEAKRFFEVSEHQLHHILCYCHHGTTISAESASHLVRSSLEPSREGVFSRLRSFVSG